jgi:PleD family two-component response regulator
MFSAGPHVRGAGMAALDSVATRAERTGESLVLAFIDIDGLKRPTTRPATPPATT